jgi:hypothetical protein
MIRTILHVICILAIVACAGQAQLPGTSQKTAITGRRALLARRVKSTSQGDARTSGDNPCDGST